MFVYIVVLWKRLLLNEADNNFTKLDVLDLEALGIIESDTTNLTIFHVLKKQLGDTPMIDEEMLRHIDISFVQLDANYNLDKKDWFNASLTVPAKNCEAKDFDAPPER